jgi:hypothetical protein
VSARNRWTPSSGRAASGARWGRWTLTSARFGAGQIATPVTRHARSWAAELRVQGSARSGSTAAPVDRLRLPWWHVGRRVAAARDRSVGCAATAASGELAHRPRRCAARVEGAARAPVVPPRSPHAPPSNCEGDLWGDLQGVGRETGSLLRLLMTPPIPHPFP